MRSDIDTAIEKLQLGHYGGLLFQDGQFTGVTIEFGEQNLMSIRGLGPDLPPFIRLGADQGTQISNDGITWEQFPTEYGFDIYRLLDPRVYAARVEPVERWEKNETIHVEGQYQIEALGLILPKDMLEWIKEHKGEKRTIQFAIRRGAIEEFSQDDFPPSRHKVKVQIVPC